ncbi:MAG: GNAT family N-acetyltransferase [Muribaculaceae bacterium]|nr:GNAT family N-acetyltransferase [Muribaculaceae bacterium]
MNIELYTPELKEEWDAVVDASRNGTFLHKRDYMDYHADRFTDMSMIARDTKGRPVAILPAHRTDDGILCSHRGLSYGGWLMTKNADMPAMMELWDAFTDTMRNAGCRELLYKPSPHIYHTAPAEEDLYALFRHGASLQSTLISSVVDMTDPLPFDMAARQSVRKAEKSGVTVAESDDFEAFWHMLTALLAERYGSRPVHTLAEIRLLRERFPQNIRLYMAMHEGEPVAGVVMYNSRTVSHSQYTATTAKGRELRSLPLLYSFIMENCNTRWFDFGTSNEDGGRLLNEGLIRQKCGFGGRGIAYNTYKIIL